MVHAPSPWPSWLPVPALLAWLEPLWARASGLAGPWAREGLRWAERHSGVPTIVLVAVLLVVGYRVFKRTVRFAVEVCVVVAVLGVLVHLGIVRF